MCTCKQLKLITYITTGYTYHNGRHKSVNTDNNESEFLHYQGTHHHQMTRQTNWLQPQYIVWAALCHHQMLFTIKRASFGNIASRCCSHPEKKLPLAKLCHRILFAAERAPLNAIPPSAVNNQKRVVFFLGDCMPLTTTYIQKSFPWQQYTIRMPFTTKRAFLGDIRYCKQPKRLSLATPDTVYNQNSFP